MKVIIPDNVVSHMVKMGMSKHAAGSVIMAVTMPAKVTTLDNGQTRYDGFGASVTGKVDSTGKFFRVSRVKVDTRP